MARRIRTVKPEFFSDQLLGQFPIETHFLAMGLISIADDEGWFNANPSYIMAEVFPLRIFADPSPNVPRMLSELSEIEFVRLYRDSRGCEFGIVDGFTRHQKVDKPKPSLIGSRIGEFTRISQGATCRRRVADESPTSRRRVAVGMEGNGREWNGSSLTTFGESDLRESSLIQTLGENKFTREEAQKTQTTERDENGTDGNGTGGSYGDNRNRQRDNASAAPGNSQAQGAAGSACSERDAGTHGKVAASGIQGEYVGASAEGERDPGPQATAGSGLQGCEDRRAVSHGQAQAARSERECGGRGELAGLQAPDNHLQEQGPRCGGAISAPLAADRLAGDECGADCGVPDRGHDRDRGGRAGDQRQRKPGDAELTAERRLEGANAPDPSIGTAEPIKEPTRRQSGQKKAIAAWRTREDFAEAAKIAALGKHSDTLVEEFVGYWTEENMTTGRMRWQGEKYFDMARRLANSQRMGYGSAAFVPPTSGEVLQYARERKMPEQWAMDFYVHYRGVGWKCGKTAMADWKVKLAGFCTEKARNQAI